MKGYLSNLLRKLGILYQTDRLRFYFLRWKNKAKNAVFLRLHPDVALPPDYLIYESFKIDYKEYYTDSANTAQWLIKYFSKYSKLQHANVLDWGCGPGRLIRHLPGLLDSTNAYYATDYNADSINWCRQHLAGIQFNTNTLEATLPYQDNFFDIIYGISIFTHLSKALHYDWYNELHRILKPGGILFVTAQGDNFKQKLTNAELKDFNAGLLVVRGKVKEGHRTYSAFHPAPFMVQLFQHAIIEAHLEFEAAQDVWIIRKK